MSPEQKLAIDQNERLTFDRYGLDPQNPRGRINHPHVSRDYKATRKLMLDGLKSICNWYNTERISPDYNPYTTAASLQHRIISLHPFGDNNGRLSRLLMNWSLETDGCNPRILEEPSDDLFTSEEDWAKSVEHGSRYTYDLSQIRKTALESIGVEDEAFILDLDREKTLYNTIYAQLDAQSPPPALGQLDHRAYEEFWQNLQREMQSFNQQATSSEMLFGARYFYEAGYQQGGLASESHIRLMRNGRRLPKIISNAFFHSHLDVYRGGLSDKLLSDEDICQMFVRPVGLTSGYQDLKKSGTAAMCLLRQSLATSSRMPLKSIINC